MNTLGSGTPKRSSRRLQKLYNDEEELTEPGSWECSVCTFRNVADTFHCEMCDTRKGTSTRKPKLNSTVVELQQTVQKIVQQQQQQDQQQPRAASSGHRPKAKELNQSPSSLNNGGVSSSADSPCMSSPTPSSTQASTPQPTSPSAVSRIGGSVYVQEPCCSSSGQSEQFLVDHQLLKLDANSARTLTVTANHVTVIITDYNLLPVTGGDGGGCPTKKRKRLKRQKMSLMTDGGDSDSNVAISSSPSNAQ